MANTKPNATQVKYKNETVYSALDRAETNITTNTNNSVRRKDYTELRAYTGPATIIDITDAGIAGRFYVVSSGTDNGGTLIVGGDGRCWQRLYTDDKYLVNWWGADLTGSDSSVAAFNAAITFANATLNNDRSLNVPMTFGMLPGRYKLDSSLDAITVSAVSFGGNSKHDTRLVITHSNPVFTFGDVSGARVPVGFSLHGCGIEYPADPTGPNAVVVDVARGHMPEIRDVVLERIGTLMRLGSASDKIGTGASVLDVTGSVANAGLPLFNLRYGAGLTIDNARIFVRGVNPPVHPAAMTTVYGTHVFKCDTGFWDTVQVSNSLFERFDIGISAGAGSGMTYQNFFFTHVTMDYLRRWCVYAEANGGTISGINIDSTSWMCSWETDAIYIGGSGYNDNHDIRCQVPIAGGAGLNYSATTAKANKFSGFRVAGCNRLGTYQAAIRFAAGSRGFDVSGASGNHDTTGSGLPWRADYGIQIGANCDDYIVSGCRMKGAVAGFIAAGNASPSSARRVHNNVGTGYAGRKSAQTIPASGVRYYNTTPYVEVWSFFGGTITGGYDLNGVGIPGALPYLTLTLEPGDNFSVGYSTAPSILVRVLV